MSFLEFMEKELDLIDRAISEIRTSELNAGRNILSSEAEIRIQNLRRAKEEVRIAIKAYRRFQSQGEGK